VSFSVEIVVLYLNLNTKVIIKKEVAERRLVVSVVVVEGWRRRV
jgi:hypothetical protein